MTSAAISWLLTGGILACLAVAVATDLENRIIPNRVTLLVLCCSLGLRLLPGAGPLWTSLLTALAVLGGLGLLATYDLIGWGDAKLIPALAFAVPPYRVVPLLLAITVTGGLLSCLYLAARHVLRHALARAEPRRSETLTAHGRSAGWYGRRAPIARERTHALCPGGVRGRRLCPRHEVAVMLPRNIVLGLGTLALLAGLGLSYLWFNQSSMSGAAPTVVQVPTQSILVASHPLPANILLRPGDMTWSDVPATEVTGANIVREHPNPKRTSSAR